MFENINWLPIILSFGAGIVIGCIFMTIMLMYVIKEGEEVIAGHHIHHHGEEKKKTTDSCEL